MEAPGAEFRTGYPVNPGEEFMDWIEIYDAASCSICHSI